MMAAGRIKYTTRLANAICKEIRNGVTLADIGKQEGMPSPSTILKWSRENEEFKKKYADACVIKVNLWCEERDELSKADPMLPMDVAKKYNLLTPQRDSKTGRYVKNEDGETQYDYDSKLLLACMRQEEGAKKLRIDVLTQNINKLAVIYDDKFKDNTAADVAAAAAAGASAGLTIQMISHRVEEKEVEHTPLQIEGTHDE